MKEYGMKSRRWSARSRSVPTLIILTAFVCAVSPRPAVADAELDRLKQEAQELVDSLKQELETVRAERKQLQAEREALRGESPTEATAQASPEEAVDSEETTRRVNILAQEVQQLKENIVLPETKEYKSFYGLGPAASKVYQVNRGLSIGGYGEGAFSGIVTETDDNSSTADFLRFVLYTGYKFSDRILLNAEIELEHATTSSTVTSSGGSVSVEFAYLDFLGSEPLNARAGLVLIPVGFINEIHEPVFFHGNNRPLVERSIIPTTWREFGAGVFGAFGGDLAYRGYITTSLNAEGFSENGIRGGRQKGNRALAEDPAGSIRLDYTPHQVPGLLVGGSTFLGGTAQGQAFADSKADAFLALWDLHAQYRHRGLELRALSAWGRLNDAAALSNGLEKTVADRSQGWYVEVAYDVMPHILPDLPRQYLAPFFRFEQVRPQDRVPSGFTPDLTKNLDVFTVGLTYKPHPQVALKLDYRDIDPEEGGHPNDINLGLGFIF